MALDRVLHGGQPCRTVAEVEAERTRLCEALAPGSEGCPMRGACFVIDRCLIALRLRRG